MKWKNEGPIISSLLDTDFYKFTMGQLVFHRYRAVPVKYAFKNRTPNIPLSRLIPEELDAFALYAKDFFVEMTDLLKVSLMKESG